MDLALALTAFLMGLAGAPHCAAMCGPACAALLGAGVSSGGSRWATLGLGTAAWAFHLSRAAGYALAGALAATGVGLLAWAGQVAPWLRPVWTLLHVAALALGLWLAVTGRQPAFLARVGRARSPTSPTAQGSVLGGDSVMILRRSPASGALLTASAGAFWVAWPCGLLQSALVVSALAHTPWSGAGVMVSFALASSLGLLWGPALWRWWTLRLGSAEAQTRLQLTVVRLAGVLLAMGSAWALGHDLWAKVWAYCVG